MPADPPPTTGGLQYMQTDSQALKNSVGTEQNWGWSPGFDLLENIPKGRLDGDLEEPVNILLDGAGDIRHIIYTVSRVRRHTDRPVHFYLQEMNLKHISRHIFFLTWFLEKNSVGELEESVAEFLELYGNSLLRDPAVSTMKRIGKRVASMLRGADDSFEDFFDFETFIKMKETDWIADQMEAWTSTKSNFNVDHQWDNRVRTDIGDRYDSKSNVMDWDFNMGLLPYTPHIRWPEYKDWRTTGIAYDWARVNPHRDTKYEYVHPNKTLAMFVNRKRDNGVYLGDVRCSPFTNFGINSEYPDLLAKQHDGSFKYSNGILALHAIRACLYEFVTGKKWEFSEFKLAWDAPSALQEQDPVDKIPEKPNVKFFFAGIDPARFHLLLNTKQDVPVKFDAMFLSCHAAQNFTSDRQSFMKPSGYVAVETVKFCVYMDALQKDAYREKLKDIMAAQGWAFSPPLTARIHRLNPKFKLAFARSDNPTLTEAQQKEKEKNDSLWVMGFINKDAKEQPFWEA
eukprot:TRINITY_DN7160_c4_g1_i1.p1 TRINITY_DN7160_c4_g1~~TRINITY_DN7160_c4_g1_i1.p1  ORF type:complete len:531 (+),score=83.53 TRINITY_DN7160_c4_g1_i1:58-1593(+)